MGHIPSFVSLWKVLQALTRLSIKGLEKAVCSLLCECAHRYNILNCFIYCCLHDIPYIQIIISDLVFPGIVLFDNFSSYQSILLLAAYHTPHYVLCFVDFKPANILTYSVIIHHFHFSCTLRWFVQTCTIALRIIDWYPEAFFKEDTPPMAGGILSTRIWLYAIIQKPHQRFSLHDP